MFKHLFYNCFSFIPAEGDATRSNMAVMEIYLPSGFVVDTDTLPTLESSERIKVRISDFQVTSHQRYIFQKKIYI